MNLDQLSRRHPALQQLLQQSARWRQLEARIKPQLPANLHGHFQVARIEEGCLVILAANNMAASRLRMLLPALVPQLQSIDSSIQNIRVKIQPRTTPPPKSKRAQLGPGARAACQDAAERLTHHPQLAAALAALSRKR